MLERRLTTTGAEYWPPRPHPHAFEIAKWPQQATRNCWTMPNPPAVGGHHLVTLRVRIRRVVTEPHGRVERRGNYFLWERVQNTK